MTEMPIRERLARADCFATCPDCIHQMDCEAWEHGLPAIDAILAEMQEPSKAMLEIGNTITSNAGDIWEPSEGISYDGPECALECWQAMIRHIRDGGT